MNALLSIHFLLIAGIVILVVLDLCDYVWVVFLGISINGLFMLVELLSHPTL